MDSLDPNDYLDYYVEVSDAGLYEVSYRVASQQSGSIALQLVNDNGTVSTLSNASFPTTGGWQNWQTVTQNVQIPAGRYTLRVLITSGPFNMNWMEFDLLFTSTQENSSISKVQIFPNPMSNVLIIQAELEQAQDLEIELWSALGQKMLQQTYSNQRQLQETLNLETIPPGAYVLRLRAADGSLHTQRLIKAVK